MTNNIEKNSLEIIKSMINLPNENDACLELGLVSYRFYFNIDQNDSFL